ncbi:hypothetical protein AAMO2058_000955200 [Amorphochlora amoebiformis]
MSVILVLLVTGVSSLRANLGEGRTGMETDLPVPRSALQESMLRENDTRTTMRHPRGENMRELRGEVIREPDMGMGRRRVRFEGSPELMESVEPVIAIDYKNAADGQTIIKSHELMLRHAPGVFGFASKCELDTAADHCVERGLADGDEFCKSGLLDTCRALLPRCEHFEMKPPCNPDQNECCKCAFQMCPLSNVGCKRINRECYSEVSKSDPQDELSSETTRAILRVFNLLDIDGTGLLDRGELAILLSAFSSAHTTTWDKLTQHKYYTLCSELGIPWEKGITRSDVYRAFSRKRGVLYNMMLRAVSHVKQGRQTTLEKHLASVQTIFALCDSNGDGVLSIKEFKSLTGSNRLPKEINTHQHATVTQLKMLYLESHFRDLDTDLQHVRSTMLGAPSLVNHESEKWIMPFLLSMVAILLLTLAALVYAMVMRPHSKLS